MKEIPDPSLDALAEECGTALGQYLAGLKETALLGAYDMGRRAMEADLGLLDVLDAYEQGQTRLLGGKGQVGGDEEAWRALLRESLGSFEMALRGYRVANAAMHESRALLDYAGTAISMKDLDGRYLLVNRRFEEAFPTREAHLVGRTDDELFSPELAHAWQEFDRAAIEAGTAIENEDHVESVDGRRTYLSTCFPVRSQSGHVFGVCRISTDITERKRAEEEALAARAEADQANRAKTDFLSRMSHELRTPLNAILGFAQLLEMDGLGQEQSESVSHILKAGRHLLSLINEVLDICRIEAGYLRISLEPVSVAEVVGESVDLMRPSSVEGRLSLRIDPDAPTELQAAADRQRLKQVLLNLLSNAIKYNRPGGEVTVSWRVLSGRIRLEVHDTGLGIAAQLMDRLFQPFERLDAPGDIEGTGLGLALCHRLVMAMGGTMAAESQLGQGSTFWLELREMESSDALTQADHSEQAPLGESITERRIKVLYVEDNVLNLRLVERILARRPEVELLVAFHGALGLELAAQHVPDVVLLDLHLPDMPGEEVLQRLQADPRTNRSRVVVVSADAIPAQVKRLRAAGAFDYLTKPFDVIRLLEVIDAAIDQDELGN